MPDTFVRSEAGVVSLMSQMTGASINAPVNRIRGSPFSRIHLITRPLGGGVLVAVVGYPPCQARGPDAPPGVPSSANGTAFPPGQPLLRRPNIEAVSG